MLVSHFRFFFKSLNITGKNQVPLEVIPRNNHHTGVCLLATELLIFLLFTYLSVKHRECDCVFNVFTQIISHRYFTTFILQPTFIFESLLLCNNYRLTESCKTSTECSVPFT